jgi:hypothetical protein
MLNGLKTHSILELISFFKETSVHYDFNNFFKGSFCYHWHNKWNNKIEDNSIIIQLVKIIKHNLRKQI